MKIFRAGYISIYMILLIIPLLAGTVSAQGKINKTITGSNITKKGTEAADSVYNIPYLRNYYASRVEEPKELINGKEYESYYARSVFKPLFFPERRRSGTLIAGTRRYDNLILDYDTYLDEVIYTDTSRTINYRFPQIALNKDIADGFIIYFENDSVYFKNFRLPWCSELGLNEGFYEVARDGKSRFLIKHSSYFYQREGLNNYKYSPKFYINTGQGFHNVKTSGELLSMFGSKAKQVKEFLHNSKIKMKKADKNQIISVLKFYESIQ